MYKLLNCHYYLPLHKNILDVTSHKLLSSRKIISCINYLIHFHLDELNKIEKFVVSECWPASCSNADVALRIELPSVLIGPSVAFLWVVPLAALIDLSDVFLESDSHRSHFSSDFRTTDCSASSLGFSHWNSRINFPDVQKRFFPSFQKNLNNKIQSSLV